MMIPTCGALNFEGQNIYIGIDVHLKSWSVTILSQSIVLKKFTQDPSALALVRFLYKNYPGATYYSVYEAGYCGFWIHEQLIELGVNNIIVNPADIPSMNKEKLRKTDAIDSNKLARGLRSAELKGIYIPCRDVLEYRSLVRIRFSIVKDLTRQKNRIKSFLRFYGVTFPEHFDNPRTHWSRRFMTYLAEIQLQTACGNETLKIILAQAIERRESLLRVTRSIRHLSHNEIFRDKMKLITSVPGVGETIGMSLLVEIDDKTI